jgi:hypothetical protein
MAAKNTQKVRMCLTPIAAATANDLTPTAITAVAATAGKPAGVKVTVANTAKVGEVVKFGDVGFGSLNNKSFVITAATATDFDIGNVTLGAGAMKVGSVISHWLETEMKCICLSEFSISTAAPSVIDTSTYCGSSSIASAKTEAGTASAAGYVDVTDAGYLTILDAVETGGEHILRVTLGDNGYLVMPVTLSGLSWTLPLDGAQQFAFQFTFGAAPKHVFA